MDLHRTCVDVGLIQEEGKTAHSVERVKVMNSLMEAVHPILVLLIREKKFNLSLSISLAYKIRPLQAGYLW